MASPLALHYGHWRNSGCNTEGAWVGPAEERCPCMDCDHGYLKTVECPCELIPCPNYAICRVKFPPEYASCWNGLCRPCNRTFRKQLTFLSAASEWTCAVCLDECFEGVYYPAACGHYYCVRCTMRLFGMEWTPDYYIDPCSFGAPPCPCPERSCIRRPCDSGGEDSLRMQAWQEADQKAFDAWERAECEADRRNDPHSGVPSCPSCRAEVRYAPGNLWGSQDSLHWLAAEAAVLGLYEK